MELPRTPFCILDHKPCSMTAVKNFCESHAPVLCIILTMPSVLFLITYTPACGQMRGSGDSEACCLSMHDLINAHMVN